MAVVPLEKRGTKRFQQKRAVVPLKKGGKTIQAKEGGRPPLKKGDKNVSTRSHAPAWERLLSATFLDFTPNSF
jgi:hypothetical protein